MRHFTSYSRIASFRVEGAACSLRGPGQRTGTIRFGVWMTRFIILRERTGNWRRPCVPLDAAIEAQDPDAGADPQIETVDLSPVGLREAARDRRILTVAPAMPTRLIAPEPMDDLREEGAENGWGLRAVGADCTPHSGTGVRVALLDTGLETGHPCFAGVDVAARDFAGTGVEDANGHGTHVAGTILGRDLGGVRIGIARGVTSLLAAKAVADNGRGRSDSFLSALLWALRKKADIVGFSLAFDTGAQIETLTQEGYPPPLACAAAVHACRGNLRIFEMILTMQGNGSGPLILGAVGNDSLRVISPEFETGPAAPVAARGVLPVAALGRDEDGLSLVPFSNAGAQLAAPGAGIVSARIGGGVRVLNGTSMALAHALGVAALWAERLRSEGQAPVARALAAKLLSTATREGLVPAPSFVDIGHGMVQAPR